MRVTAHLWPLLTIAGAAAMSPRVAQQRSPGNRNSAALVYDAARKELVLFGGIASDASEQREPFPRDLWAWNGTSWRQLIPSDGAEPPGRALPNLVYDSARRRIVMFGGRRETRGGTVEKPGGMWEWDGRRWHEITSDTMPMLHAAAAYDPARGHVMMFGGVDTGISRKLQEWDGRAWHVQDSGGPPVPTERVFPAVSAFTPAGELLVVTMQSANSADSVASLTWAWNGNAWARRELGPALTSLQPAASAPDGTIYVYQTSAFWLSAPVMHTRSPAGVWTHVSPQVRPVIHGIPAAAYDPSRKRFVLYSDALWEWDGTRWEKRS